MLLHYQFHNLFLLVVNCNRKVLRDMASGGREAERVKLKLEIQVEEVDRHKQMHCVHLSYLFLKSFLCFQVADYDKEGSILRVRGKNILENEYVKVTNKLPSQVYVLHVDSQVQSSVLSLTFCFYNCS